MEEDIAMGNEEDVIDRSFYRIINSPVLVERRLALPVKFVSEHGDGLSNTVKLVLPIGTSWYIGLKKSDSLFHLHDEWSKFMKHHSIDLGYSLLFKYKGKSEFSVHIFNANGNEIQYPVGCKNSRRTTHTNDVAVNDGGIRYGAQVIKEKEDYARAKPLASVGPSDGSGQKTSSNGNVRRSSRKHSDITPAADASGEDRALSAAMMYKTENPSVVVKLKDSHIAKSYSNFKVPIKFAAEHMPHCAEFIELQDSDNNKWLVYSGSKKDGRTVRFGKGWPQFAKSKNLQIGDVCVFEVIKTNSILKVSVFHAMP